LVVKSQGLTRLYPSAPLHNTPLVRAALLTGCHDTPATVNGAGPAGRKKIPAASAQCRASTSHLCESPQKLVGKPPPRLPADHTTLTGLLDTPSSNVSKTLPSSY